jgi:hypothetical protein
MSNENKVIYGGILFGIILWFFFKKKGNYSVRPSINSTFIDPAFDYKAFAKRLYDAIDGIDWTSTKAAVFEELNYMNDEEFKLVYNIYNQTYAKKKNTLRTDINGEWIWGSGVSALESRFNRLQLP